MSSFGGSATFGSAVFGGDPVPFLLLQVDAEMTSEARRITARGMWDGTSLQALTFSVGRGGFDPYDYHAAIPVNRDAQALSDSVFTDAIDHVEVANESAKIFYCLLDTTEANETLGEIALHGEVQNSPGDPDDNTEIVMAIGHFPLIAKNDTMRYVLRVVMQP